MNLLKKSVKGLLFSLILFLILTLTGAVLMRFTPFPELWGRGYLIFALAAVCFAASCFIGAAVQRTGIFCGLLTSIIITGILFLIISALLNGTIDFTQLLQIIYLIPICFGMLGGILGVNLKK